MVEAVVAAAGLALGGIAAGLVAMLYGALAVAAWRLYARSPGTACGCLGASDAPVTVTHVAVNLAAATVAAFAIAHGSPLTAVGSGVWLRVAFVLLVACGAGLAASLLDALPTLGALTREGRSR